MPKGAPASTAIRAQVARRAAASVLFLLVCLASWFAAAAGAGPLDATARRRTVLLVAAQDDPTAARIAAELTTLGFDVRAVRERRTADAPITLSEIELLSGAVDAVATVGVNLGTGDTRVWTPARQAPEQMVLRAVVALDTTPAIGALRAVEALRTLLNQVGSGADATAAPTALVQPPPQPVDVDAGLQPAVPTIPSAAPPSLGLTIAPALAASRGTFGPSWQGLLALHVLFRRPWGIELVGVVPITGGHAQQTEGSASLVLGLAAAGLHWRPLALRWCLLDVGAGLGAAWLHTESSPSAGYVGEKNDTFVATPFLRAGYAVPLTSGIWIRADLASLIALPRPAFTVADRTLRSWGWPVGIGSVGIEIALH